MIKFLRLCDLRFRPLFRYSQLYSYSSLNEESKDMDNLENNPFFGKYSEKIARLKQTSPQEYLERIEEAKRKYTPKHNTDGNYSSLSQPKPSNANILTKKKYLNDIMKMDLIQDKSVEEIKQIWIEYHKSRDCIAATIPSESYKLLLENSAKYPIFLLPLPRNQGYEFVMCQFSGDEVHFTPLINYQAYKENAPECLTIVHYTEFQERGLILMRGNFNDEQLKVTEAQFLTNQLQMYFMHSNEKRQYLLETFTKSPDTFKYMDLVAELEYITLDPVINKK